MKRAFTLVEMMVAVAVLAFLGALTFGVIAGLFATEEDLDELVDVHHMARLALDRMGKDLSHAYLSLNIGPEENIKHVFLGDEDRVVFSFFGNIPTRAGQLETDQGVVEYRLGRRSDDHGGRKLVRRFKAHHDDDPESGGEEVVIAVGVKSLELAYRNEEQERWESSWRADDALSDREPGYVLPPRVRIKLKMVTATGAEFDFETQTLIYLREPLLFGRPHNPTAAEWQAKQAIKKAEERAKAGLPPAGGIPPLQTPPPAGGRPGTPAPPPAGGRGGGRGADPPRR